MNRSRRGAAQVSVVWVVTLGFLFLAGLLFGFNAHQKAQASALWSAHWSASVSL